MNSDEPKGTAPSWFLEGQRSIVTIFDTVTNEKHIVCTADYLIEAPNWTLDGRSLIVNSGGKLHRIDVSENGARDTTEEIAVLINTEPTSDLNNDHVLSPDGLSIFVSSNDNHLYKVSLAGGTPTRVSNSHDEPFHYYLHGISPDGQELAFVGVEWKGEKIRANIFTIPAAGGSDKRLLDISEPSDGPEYSPDGQWIYFNSELGATTSGAQIFRMKRDASGIEQLTFDERVNWFPHISPNGKKMVLLSFPPGTQGHPANKNVIIRLMNPEGGVTRDLASFFGGQGSINVNSWAPDNRRFAYVEYPLAVAGR